MPPDGGMRRSIGDQSSLMMKQSFWEPIFSQWKEDYPHMFENDNGKDSSEDWEKRTNKQLPD